MSKKNKAKAVTEEKVVEAEASETVDVEQKQGKKTENKQASNAKQAPKKVKKEKKHLIKRKTKETVSELKKVTWPKFPYVVKKTGVVLVVVVIFAVLLFGIDMLFSVLFNLLTTGTVG